MKTEALKMDTYKQAEIIMVDFMVSKNVPNAVGS